MSGLTALSFLRLCLISCLIPASLSCGLHGDVGSDGSPLAELLNYRPMTEANNAAPSTSSRPLQPSRLTLTNVRVFDGTSLQPPSTVIIEGTHIARMCSSSSTCASHNHATTYYDAEGMTLLPGFIDAHTHPLNTTHLTSLTRAGITTAVNAFCPSPPLCASLRHQPGLTVLVTASFIATSPNSTHARMVLGMGVPDAADLLIRDISQVPGFVAQQVAQGAEFIKLVGSAPGPGLGVEGQAAVVAAAHAAGERVVLHAASYEAYEEGLRAGVDQIHHAPLDVAVDERLVRMFKGMDGVVAVCPTLTMMRATVEALGGKRNLSFAAAVETVARLHGAGVPILAGTDANLQPGAPAQVPFGSSLHDELENLVQAGLSPVEALNAATALPARHFGLVDRGVVREGMRADLVLVDGDPTVDITASRRIVKVWVRGVEYEM